MRRLIRRRKQEKLTLVKTSMSEKFYNQIEQERIKLNKQLSKLGIKNKPIGHGTFTQMLYEHKIKFPKFKLRRLL